MNTDSSHRDDLELARAARAGEPAAQQRFAARMECVPRILAARNERLGRPLGDDELADLAQDTALRIWRKLADFSGRAALETWIYSFCSFELFNAIRRRGRLPRNMTDVNDRDLPPEPSEEPAEPSEDALEPMLRRLSVREAEVVRMRHVDLLDFRQTGEALGISASSAKTHYYRALEKLRDLLADQEERA